VERDERIVEFETTLRKERGTGEGGSRRRGTKKRAMGVKHPRQF